MTFKTAAPLRPNHFRLHINKKATQLFHVFTLYIVFSIMLSYCFKTKYFLIKGLMLWSFIAYRHNLLFWLNNAVHFKQCHKQYTQKFVCGPYHLRTTESRLIDNNLLSKTIPKMPLTMRRIRFYPMNQFTLHAYLCFYSE